MMLQGNLPQGWFQTTLGIVADWGSGGTPARKEPSYYNGTVPWIKTGDLGPKFINDTSEYISELGVQHSSAKYFPKGSVAIAMYGATIGKTSILGIDATTNQACGVGFPVAGLTFSEYLYYFLLNEKDNFIAKGKGGAQPNISQTLIKEHKIALPPLAEQKVIADKLDTLLAQVETTKARLERIPDILKRFRQSVLAAAVSGKLTEEWRINAPVSNSNLNELPENAKTRRGLPDHVSIPDSMVESSFPKNWDVLSVASLLRKGVIVDLKDGNHGANHPKSSEFTEQGLPFITAAQMGDDGSIDYTGAPKVSGKPLEKLKVGFAESDDVIYSHKGTVGRVGIADRSCVLSPQTTYIRLNPKYVSNNYYAIMLKSYAFTAQVDSIKSQTTRDFVPITAQYSLFSVIPPIAEQIEIVRRVEELFAYAEIIEQKTSGAFERVSKLTQSILAKAFRGELTADWRAANPDLISGENSAEALLEKIKAERAELKKQPKPKRTSAKKKTGNRMSKEIIKVVEALKQAEKPLSGQQLLAAAGYPSDSGTDELEKFFLDIRESLNREKSIVKIERSEDGQDWFALAEASTHV